VKSVHVLFRIDRVDDPGIVQGRGQRQLHQDGVDVLAGVQLGDGFEHHGFRHVVRKIEFFHADARVGAGFLLEMDIQMRSRVVADQDDTEARREAEAGDLLADVVLDLRRDGFSVDQFCGHG
jgi:hypothetical protein